MNKTTFKLGALLLQAYFLVACSGIGQSVGSMQRSLSSTAKRASATQSFASDARKIWVHPNAGQMLSQDSVQLFDNGGSEWSQVLDQTNVFQMFQASIASYNADQLKRMVSMFKARNISIALESYGLLPYSCSGTDPAGVASSKAFLRDVQPIYDAGGKVDFVSLDTWGFTFTLSESNRPDNNCKFNFDQGVGQLIVFMQSVHQVHPEINFGLIVGMPDANINGSGSYFGGQGAFGGADLRDVFTAVVKAIRASGEQIYFTHIDSPYKYFSNHPGVADVYNQRLLPFKSVVEGLGLRFGLIMMSDLGGGGACDIPNRDDLSAQFVDDNLKMLGDYSAHGGLASADFITESWCYSPTKLMTENDQNSFMYLANRLIYNYKTFLGQQGLSLPTKNRATSLDPVTVIGSLEKVSNAGFSGWTCLPHNSASLNINVFAGGAENAGGSLIYSGVASQASDSGLQAQCQSGGTAYRFAVSWPAGSRANFANQPLYVYGTSPVDGTDVELANSGQMTIPSAPTTLVAAVVAPVAAAPVANLPVATPAVPVVAQAPAPADSVATPAVTPAVTVVTPAPADATVSAPAAPVTHSTKTIYRFNGSGGHMFAESADGTGVPSQFSIEGAAFSVYADAFEDTNPLYRCNTNGHQFLSTDSGCEGQTYKGQMGNVAGTRGNSRQALYRLHNDGGDYIEDTNPDFYVNLGYTVDGVLGYIP